MEDFFVTEEQHCSELERAINELLDVSTPEEETTLPEPPLEPELPSDGDELQGIFGAQS